MKPLVRASALERLLRTERVRRRSTPSGFAVPALHETAIEPEDGPFLVTTATGPGFAPGRARPDRTLWAGFKECSLDEEGPLLRQLYDRLWSLSEENGWANRCSRLEEASPLLDGFGFEPVSLVVPLSFLGEACGEEITTEEAETLMATQGYVTMLGDVQVLSAELPEGAAILTPGISLAGTYVRADDYLAVMAFRVDRAWVLVGDHGVA